MEIVEFMVHSLPFLVSYVYFSRIVEQHKIYIVFFPDMQFCFLLLFPELPAAIVNTYYLSAYPDQNPPLPVPADDVNACS